MSSALLLKHFDRISETPDAIARLRRFILDLAVRGKLVEQDREDEPNCLVRGSVSDKDIVGDWETEGLWAAELPRSWQWRKLGTIAEQITDGEHATPPRIHDKQVPLVTAKNVRDGFMDYENTDWVSLETAKKAWGRCRPGIGDILLVCVGATTGRLCILRDARDMVLVRSVALIRPRPSISVDYLALVLRSPLCQGQIWKKVKVTAQPCLYINRIQSLLIPLPPVSEQHRIVAKVDELMVLCDRLKSAQTERENRRLQVAASSLHHLNNGSNAEIFQAHARFYLNHLPQLTNLPEQIQPLRQTILNLAVRGLLVRQDPKEEPASALLRSIQARKECLIGKGKIKKTKACRPQGEKVVPHDVPASWSWAMLGEITDVGTGSTPSRTQALFWEAGSIPWITSGSTSQKIITKGDEFVTETAVKAHRLRLYPRGTLLVALYGQGRTRGQVTTLGIESTINQACAAICPLQGFEALHPYLRLLLEKNYDEVRLLSAGGPQPNLNVQKVKEILVPVPPLAEQHRIVAKVNDLMTICDRLEVQLTITQAESRRLLEAVLSEALNDENSSGYPP